MCGGRSINFLLNRGPKTQERSALYCCFFNDDDDGICNDVVPIFCSVLDGDVPRVPIFVRKTQFRLPFKSVTPVVMIGPGTGLAPFRGFIQDRHIQKQNGQ